MALNTLKSFIVFLAKPILNRNQQEKQSERNWGNFFTRSNTLHGLAQTSTHPQSAFDL